MTTTGSRTVQVRITSRKRTRTLLGFVYLRDEATNMVCVWSDEPFRKPLHNEDPDSHGFDYDAYRMWIRTDDERLTFLN